MEHWRDLLGSGIMPFILQTGQHPRFNLSKLFESIIIGVVTAGLTAGVVMYATQQVMTEKFNAVEWRLAKIEAGQAQNTSTITDIRIDQARSKGP